MNERRAIKILEGIDRARRPPPDFERALRAELFGGLGARGTPTELSDSEVAELSALEPNDASAPGRRTRRKRWFLVAAALAVILVGVSVPTVEHERSVVVAGAARPTVEAACRRFNTSAFAEVPRTTLLGAASARALGDRVTAHRLVSALRGALAAFRVDLRGAKLRDAAIDSALARSYGFTSRALTFVDEGSLALVPTQMNEVESSLVVVQSELTKRGIASCL